MEVLNIIESFPDVFGLGRNAAMHGGVPRVRCLADRTDPRDTSGRG
jgi:hypothetical protein